MTTIRLVYVHEFRDRHGKVRRYFRRPGRSQVPLPGLPGSEEFMAAYHAALAEQPVPRAIAADRTKPGTISALVVAYYNSAAFQHLSPATQATYRGIIEQFRRDNGHRAVATLQRKHIETLISNRAKTPAAANSLLRMLRTLMQFAVANGFRADDPTLAVKSVRVRSKGFHTWTDEEIATYEAKHAIGSRARLAFALLLHTAQRRSDVVRMGRQHIRDGVLTIKQQKTGTTVNIPVSDELQLIIDSTPSGQLTFLVTEAGKPFSAAGFGNLFREWCDEAGLKHCASHGLRKAKCRRLAEASCTPHEIMSWTGHASSKELEPYTEAADRLRMAARAAEKERGLKNRTSSGKP